MADVDKLGFQHTLISLAGLGVTAALAWHGSIDGQSAVLLIGGTLGITAVVANNQNNPPAPPVQPAPPALPPAPAPPVVP